MLRILIITTIVCLTALFNAHAEHPDNEIRYTTTDHKPLELNITPDAVDSEKPCTITNSIVSHKYTNNEGVICLSKTITHIGADENNELMILFAGCENLASITLPSTITTIGAYAFDSCTNLRSIQLPDAVSSIGTYAFSYCTSLSQINLHNITDIGGSAFYGCSNLREIVLPRSMTVIQEWTFAECSSLASIILPESITTIDEYAFSYCTSLDNVTIPESVTTLGEYAFNGCSSLKNLTIPNSISSIGEYSFCDCNIQNIVINAVLGIAPQYTMSLDMRRASRYIGRHASADGCCVIKDGTLLHYAANDTTYTIPDGVTTIGTGVFKNRTALTEIVIPTSVTSIGNEAFWGCQALEQITIPSSITTIGDNAFRGCSNLKRITIPNSIERVGRNAFYGCNISEITIDAISDRHFKNLDGLDRKNIVAYTGKNASTDGRCFIVDGVLMDYLEGAPTYDIPEGVTTIGIQAFKGCHTLTSVTLPSSVSLIEEEAFMGCVKLTTISLPENLTHIKTHAFSNCFKLSEIIIGSNVAEIGTEALVGCISLTSIRCNANTPPAIDDLGITENTTIYIPHELVKLYNKSSNWAKYKKQIKSVN